MNEDAVKGLKANMAAAIEAGDTDKFIDELVSSINDEVYKGAVRATLEKYAEIGDVNDEVILAQRGIKPLTAEEKGFYETMIKAKGELTNFSVALPVTTSSRVYDKMIATHELLQRIDFIDSKGLTDWIISKNLDYAATWGDLNDAVTAEAAAAFAKVEFSQFKLSCWMPVPVTMLDLGMTWLDEFVTTYLAEIISRKLEDAIVNGNGQKKPVGMIKAVDIENQTVPAVTKEAVAITDLSTMTVGHIAAELTANGTREVKMVDMIVNQYDYYDLVYPAIFYTDTDGNVKKTNLPLNVIQSIAVPSKKAIFGLCDEYFATVGFGKNGKVQYSDHYKFLEDQRTFKARCVAYGTPKDNDSFIYADISGLMEAAVPTRNAKTRSNN